MCQAFAEDLCIISFNPEETVSAHLLLVDEENEGLGGSRTHAPWALKPPLFLCYGPIFENITSMTPVRKHSTLSQS